MTEPRADFRAMYPSDSKAFRRSLARAVIYPVLLLIVLIVIFLWQLDSMSRTYQRVEHSNAVIAQASTVLNLLVDMETGLRGYLMTGDTLFLEPYQTAQSTIDANCELLSTLVADNTSQTQSIEAIQANIDRWQQFAASQLTAKSSGSRVDDTATQLVGKQLMDTIRSQLAAFVNTEDHLRNERIHTTQTTSQAVIISVILGGLIIGGLLAFFIRQQLIRLSQSYQHALSISHQQSEELMTQREWLRGVLSSIGDAVIATDVTGNITFINEVTEQLTGWSATEAAGKPLASVYHVVEQPEQPQQSTDTTSPLKKLYLQRLITRSNQELAIDDNAAAIKDAYGKPLGTVIVFRDATRRQVVEQERLNLIKTQTHYTTLLRRSNEQLQQFAYIASYDLQEPLRMVISYLQLLEHRYAPLLDTDAREFIGFAMGGAERMKELITGLLQYARLDTGEQNMNELTSLQTVLDKALTNLSVAINSSGAVVTHDALPKIHADSLQMMQLFQNLISNAIKFRGKEPLHIHIGAEKKMDEWQFSVRDNGIGIAPEYQERIFGIFQRLNHRTEYEGTGIGLAICKKVVERHHGHIWVISTEGKGSSFNFTLPIEITTPTETLSA